MSWGGYWAADKDCVNDAGDKLFFGKGVKLFIQSSKNKQKTDQNRSFNFWVLVLLIKRESHRTVRETEESKNIKLAHVRCVTAAMNY